jgi:hypothetical protein
MVINTSETSVRFVGTILVFLGYIGFFWRTFKSNPGNRLIECGSMTVIVFMAVIPLTQFGELPDWLIVSWVILVVVLCFSTLFFVAQRIYRAVRRHEP